MNDHNIEVATMLQLCEEINTPRTLAVYIIIKNGDFVAYLNLDINANNYECHKDFEKDYLITKFLSKWKGFITGKSLDEVTIASWFASERRCQLTNARLRHEHGVNSRVSSIIFGAQRKIAHILGPVPSLSSIHDHSGWSKGGTVDLRRGVDFTTKMTSRITVTSSAFRYIATTMGSDPVWCESIGLDISGPCTLMQNNFNIVESSKHIMVPKNAKTHRNISSEPTANIYLQKGIGAILRRKLARVGVNLNDQTLNQYLASIAHKADLCTVDLSSASDTISKMLVLNLLPIDWYLLLNDLRTKSSKVKGETVLLEKFSSQGNGFTFELESIIFYALTCAVNEYEGCSNFFTNVFGDDIITNACVYDILVEVLDYCGFEVNLKKSYSKGQFYESCGKHYFGGKEVTPVYQKEISDKREEQIRLHNRIYRWCSRTGLEKSKVLTFVRKVYKNKFKDKYEPRIPGHSVSDDGFLVDARTINNYCVNLGWRCVVYRYSTRLKRPESEIAAYSHKLHYEKLISSDPKGHLLFTNPNGFYRYTKGWYHY